MGGESGWALRYASEELSWDRDLVIEAMRTDGGALHFAPQALRGEPALQPESVRNNHIAGAAAQAPTASVIALTRIPNQAQIAVSLAWLDGQEMVLFCAEG